MIIPSAERLCQCAKPNCSFVYTHRHHKACETMWLRAFARLAKSKRYKAFLKRYREFHEEDTVELCENHHEEIHFLYGAVIMREIRKRKMRKIKTYTWSEAEAVMKVLRDYCDKWVKKETAGMPPKKFKRNW